jgi:acyl-coenzyme A thioesterase PaaI-like protein
MQGEWLEVRAEPSKVGRTIAFAGAEILSNDTLIARASGIFKMIASGKT